MVPGLGAEAGKQARQTTLALESRFDLAYNAAHVLCLAALRWHGYRSAKPVIPANDHNGHAGLVSSMS